MKKFGLDEKVIEEIVKVIANYAEVEKAVIFGSRVRGDYRDGSDIDIAYLVIVNTSINTNIFYEIDNLYIVYKVDLINFNSLEKEDKLKENILREGVEIYAK